MVDALFYLPVILIQDGFKRDDRCDSAGHLLDVTNLVFRERTAQELLFPVRKPFLDDLIPADGVVPNSRGNVRPVCPSFRYTSNVPSPSSLTASPSVRLR